MNYCIVKNAKTKSYACQFLTPEGYLVFESISCKSKTDCINNLRSILERSTSKNSYKRKLESKKGYSFLLTSKNGKELGRSNTYPNQTHLRKAVDSFINDAPAARAIGKIKLPEEDKLSIDFRRQGNKHYFVFTNNAKQNIHRSSNFDSKKEMVALVNDLNKSWLIAGNVAFW